MVYWLFRIEQDCYVQDMVFEASGAAMALGDLKLKHSRVTTFQRLSIYRYIEIARFIGVIRAITSRLY